MVTRLEAFRRAKKWTQEQLAERLGCQQPQVSRYCKAVSQPRPQIAARMSELTQGVIHLGNYAEIVSEDQATAMMAEIERAEASA